MENREGMLKVGGSAMNFEAYRRARRIEALLDRLDRRGSRLMNMAIETRGGPGYEECLNAIKIIRDRCIKIAVCVNRLSRPVAKRSA
jgi:hypothetical protein